MSDVNVQDAAKAVQLLQNVQHQAESALTDEELGAVDAVIHWIENEVVGDV